LNEGCADSAPIFMHRRRTKDTIAITIAMVCVPMSLSAPAFSADRRKVVVAQQLSLIRSPDAPICVRNLG
jgi:hypothetical protein